MKPFAVKDCDLVAIATGRRAKNLKELRDHIVEVHPGSVYYHFWGGLLRSRFSDPEYKNDFASWAYHSIRDLALAERLGVIDPSRFSNLEDLRLELIDVIDERLKETNDEIQARPDQYFHFIRSQIVVFDTRHRTENPDQLAKIIPHFPLSSVFYHFIDARRRTRTGMDDFRQWLSGLNGRYGELTEKIGELDPYFIKLSDIRRRLALLFDRYCGGIDR